VYRVRSVQSLEDVPSVILCDRYRLSTLVYQDTLPPEFQETLHIGLGMTREPNAYLVYVPTQRFEAPIENRWDDLTDIQYQNLGQRYVQMSKHVRAPSFIHDFTGETPEQIFEKFTNPSIIEVCRKNELLIAS
jgi:hypothetical protein